MPARGGLGRLNILAASDLVLPLRVEPVPCQRQPTALQPQQASRGAAGVDPAGADLAPPAALVLRERLPEAVPIGADEHQQPAVARVRRASAPWRRRGGRGRRGR